MTYIAYTQSYLLSVWNINIKFFGLASLYDITHINKS